ncbi:hypothetical protein T484DRAFT_1768120 [Baffinella frigidus]|nr:hypothetical protein T484DRAFT_1768120 [Cryptophyta sp. CCMP2293]
MPPGIARSIKHGGGEVLREQVAAHMVEEEVAAHMVEEEVECVTLSGLLSEFDLDAMAIDTEGYDLEIVRQLLKTPIRPRVIFLEIGLLSGRDQDEAHTILQAEGYTTRPCGYGMELLAVKRQLLPPPEPEL